MYWRVISNLSYHTCCFSGTRRSRLVSSLCNSLEVKPTQAFKKWTSSWLPLKSGLTKIPETPFVDLTDVTLADEDTSSILTDNAAAKLMQIQFGPYENCSYRPSVRCASGNVLNENLHSLSIFQLSLLIFSIQIFALLIYSIKIFALLI